MDKVLEEYKLAGLNQEEIDNLTDQFLFCSEVDFVIKKNSQQSPAQDIFTGGFYQAYKEVLTPITLKILQKN